MISVMICRSPKYGIVKAAKEVFWGSQQKKVVLQHSGLLQNIKFRKIIGEGKENLTQK